uniref:Transmembrane protein 59 like n=1 Tax=Anas platyrhynchos TaxID=8839 RepID=A0A8B9T9C6_ANAPL
MASPGPRAPPFLVLGLLLAAAAATAASAAAATDPFSPQLGDTGACHRQCGRSLQHRADAVLNACYRGCRLFSICHFVDASAALNTTRAECEAACAEAYSNAQERFGCRTGCRKQLPEVESRMDKSPEVKAPAVLRAGFGLHLLQRHRQLCPELHLLHLDLLPAGGRWQSGGVPVPAPAGIPPARGADDPAGAAGTGGQPPCPAAPRRPPAEGGEAPPREGAAGQNQTRGHPAAGARFPGLHGQALGPSSLDPGRLPLPLHHGDAVAELRQLGDGPRAARQDPASEHQRGQGVPGRPGRPRSLPPAARHRRHPVPLRTGEDAGPLPLKGRPGQNRPVALLPLPHHLPATSLSPSPCRCPRVLLFSPVSPAPRGLCLRGGWGGSWLDATVTPRASLGLFLLR